MQYQILGDLRVVRDGQPIVELGPPKQRALLALLVLSAGRPVPAEKLVDQLWAGRPPRTAGHSVQVYVSDLRARLRSEAAEPIERHPGGYLLRAEPGDVDASAFEALLADGRAALVAGRPGPAARVLSQALALWRGPALDEFAGEEFAQDPIAWLEQLRLDGMEALSQAFLDVGDATEALRAAQEAVSAAPLRERPRELLMRALYRLGRHADALRAYGHFDALLGEELGIEPSPELRRVYERVLLHDPDLLPPSSARAVPATRNPYKGLRPFTREDAQDFFGREQLVDRILDELRLGARLVTLVGPSGSGKSSVLAAGVLPRLPEVDGRRPVVVTVDEHGAALLERGAKKGSVLVVDQLEEIFLDPDPTLPRRFLRALAAALSVPDVSALATLRADFYDRPLQHAEVAETFLAGAVTVLPLSAADIELAVIRPAALVGVRLEDGLAAEIVADAVDRPGALPLLQYALTELFERGMTLGAYRELGRLSGALHRRAERLFGELSMAEQHVATVLHLRLARVVDGERHSRRRATLGELTAGGTDPVALSRVLQLFVGHRLLTLDRDPATGEATVELAHESLLWEWDRYAAWVERHRSALVDRDALVHAVDEWESSGCDPDFLLRGRRLDRFRQVASDALLTTPRERALIDASLAEREAEQAQAARRRRHRRRTAVVGGTAAVALAGAAAFSTAVLSTSNDPTRVTLLFHDGGTEIDQAVRLGFDRGVAAFDVVGQVHSAGPEDAAAVLDDLSREGADALLVFTIQTDVPSVARRHPDVHYVVVDQDADLPNVTAIVSRDEEGAFLAGAAAAMTTRTGTVGFVGGVQGELIGRFEAGFVAGARATRPDIRVLVDYLSVPPDLHGFDDPLGGEQAARAMYEAGADVVFAAAGRSGLGAFEAAADMLDEDGRQRWAIGVDEDQYHSIRTLNGVVDPARWQRHILTSVTKTPERTVYDVLGDLEDGEMAAGRREVGLRDGAVGLSWSGGWLDHRRAALEKIRARIVSGELRVPHEPGTR